MDQTLTVLPQGTNVRFVGKEHWSERISYGMTGVIQAIVQIHGHSLYTVAFHIPKGYIWRGAFGSQYRAKEDSTWTTNVELDDVEAIK